MAQRAGKGSGSGQDADDGDRLAAAGVGDDRSLERAPAELHSGPSLPVSAALTARSAPVIAGPGTLECSLPDRGRHDPRAALPCR